MWSAQVEDWNQLLKKNKTLQLIVVGKKVRRWYWLFFLLIGPPPSSLHLDSPEGSTQDKEPSGGKYLESGSQEARVKMEKKDRKEWKVNQVCVIDVITLGVWSCNEPWKCTSELSPENVVPGAYPSTAFVDIHVPHRLKVASREPQLSCTSELPWASYGESTPALERTLNLKSWIFVCLRCKSISIHGGMSTTAAAEVGWAEGLWCIIVKRAAMSQFPKLYTTT